MKLDVTQQLKEIDGTPAMLGEKNTPYLLRKVLVDALLFSYNDEQTLSGEDKLLRYELAMKVQYGEVVEVKVEDVALMKKLVAKAYSPLVVGQVWKMLDG